MIIYNVTTKVAEDIKEAWVQWMKEEHVPALIATGCFTDAKILRLLEVDDEEGPTYTVQYFAESKALYNLYMEKFMVIMRQEAFQKWGNQFISFRSLMEVVS